MPTPSPEMLKKLARSTPLTAEMRTAGALIGGTGLVAGTIIVTGNEEKNAGYTVLVAGLGTGAYVYWSSLIMEDKAGGYSWGLVSSMLLMPPGLEAALLFTTGGFRDDRTEYQVGMLHGTLVKLILGVVVGFIVVPLVED